MARTVTLRLEQDAYEELREAATAERRDYWQAVGRVMPDYERRREELRQRGSMLAW